MWKKNYDFSPEALSQLLHSPQAMALAAMLQKADPNLLRQVADAETKGNTEAAKELLSPLLKDPNISKLAGELGEKHGGI